MVKVDIGTMGEQVSSVSSTVSSRVSALESSIQSLDAFNEAGGLQGSAYEGAKSYATGILVPMLQALILYEEALDADTTQNQTAYSNYFSDSKDSAELEADIADFQSAKEAALWTMRVYSEPGNKASQAEKNATKAAYNDAAAGLRDAQEELRQLHEFNERSAQHFTETASLQSTVMSALSQISTQFSSFSAGSGFTAFVNKTPDWAKKVNSEWEKRTKVNDRLEAVNQKLKNGEPLTDKDIKAIRAYQDRYPSKELPKLMKDALDEYYYDFDDIPETLFSKAGDPKEWIKEWSWGTVGKILDDANEVAIKQGKNLGRVFGAKLQPRDTLGRFVKDTIKSRAWLSGKLKGMSDGTSKLLGHAAKFIGFGITASMEGIDHYNKHKNVGRAISYGTVGGIVAVGAGIVAGTIGAAMTLPVWGTLAVGIAVGTVASAGLKAVYENIKPVKDVIDGAGDLLNKGGKAVSDGVKSIGKSFSKPIGSLKGVFGW